MVRRYGPIIVEGPDGSGKTTLAKKLADECDKEYRRPPEELQSSTTGASDGLFDWWEGQLAAEFAHLHQGIYDRCTYISDPIYRQAQSTKPLLVHGRRLANGIMTLWNAEPLMVFCLPPFEVQLSNVRSDGRARLEGVDEHMLEKIDNSYWAYYAMWKNSLYGEVMLYDYTDPYYEDFVDNFKEGL